MATGSRSCTSTARELGNTRRTAARLIHGCVSNARRSAAGSVRSSPRSVGRSSNANTWSREIRRVSVRSTVRITKNRSAQANKSGPARSQPYQPAPAPAVSTVSATSILASAVFHLCGNLVMAGARGVLGGEIVKAALRNDLHDRQRTVVQDRDREFPAVDVLLDQRRRAVGERRVERGPEGSRFADDSDPQRRTLADRLDHQGELVAGR